MTAKDRPVLKPVKLGKPIAEVCQAFFSKENSTRYRARLELSGRETREVAAAVAQWARTLDPAKPDDAQALLECLWVFEEHRVPKFELLKKVLSAAEPRVRAAAIRTLGHWGDKLSDWEPTLNAAATAIVRPSSEPKRSKSRAVSYEGIAAAEIIFEVAGRPTDPELDTVADRARGQINVDKLVQESIASRKPLSKAAQSYALRNASVDDLLKLPRTEAVYEAILRRPEASATAATRIAARLASPNKEGGRRALPVLFAVHRRT